MKYEDDGSPTTLDDFNVTYDMQSQLWGLLVPTPFLSLLIIAVSGTKLTTVRETDLLSADHVISQQSPCRHASRRSRLDALGRSLAGRQICSSIDD